MRRLDCVATARASFYVYNTQAEVDTFINALEDAGRYFEDTGLPPGWRCRRRGEMA